MGNIYRDYGYIEGSEPVLVEANEKFSQVYDVTHDGAGNRLPHMLRSFISFSYGGKPIEDFGLVAITGGSTQQLKLYSDFVDNVTSTNIVDGQLYWSTHFKENTIDFVLSTDGITDKQLSDFKYWFKPGIERELILSEHPNRAILARIGQLPVFNFIPFEEDIEVTLGGRNFNTKTTMYKGSVTLSFVMDNPFWYSVDNILMYKNGNIVSYDHWIDANGNIVYIRKSPDALKIVAEDGTVVNSMLTADEILFGNGLVVDETTIPENPGEDTPGPSFKRYQESSMDSGVNNCKYLYYAGTAPGKPIIKFSVTPILSQKGYIISPCNEIDPDNGGKTYNTLFFEGSQIHEFKFTTPSYWTGYNQVIDVLQKATTTTSWVEVQELINSNVKHYLPRSYALGLINDHKPASEVNVTQETKAVIIGYMRNLLYDSNNELLPATFLFNCEYGRAQAAFVYYDNNRRQVLEENVGDMVRSNYLILAERNYPSDNGYIVKWTENNPNNSYRIYHDVDNGLSNFNIEYKFLYL